MHIESKPAMYIYEQNFLITWYELRLSKYIYIHNLRALAYQTEYNENKIDSSDNRMPV